MSDQIGHRRIHGLELHDYRSAIRSRAKRYQTPLVPIPDRAELGGTLPHHVALEMQRVKPFANGRPDREHANPVSTGKARPGW